MKNSNSSLGNHCVDLQNFECSQTSSLVSHSKFCKNSTSTTANTSIVLDAESKNDSSLQNCHIERNEISQNNQKLTQDGFDFSFNPSKCAECGGKCCIGESGYIFLSKDEMGKIAEFLGIDFGDFTRRFVRQVGAKYSLIEKPHDNGFACIFFDESTRQCQIYPVRPAQCKEFPFWDIFKNNPQGAKRECEGVEAKVLTPPPQIRQKNL